jgi:Fic/DOC family
VTFELSEIPAVDLDLVRDHAEAHRHLDDLLSAADPAVGRLLTRLAHRTTIAVVSNIRPTVRGTTAPPLFPPPRSFLSRTDVLRLEGTAAAYRHLDSRLAMVRQGLDEPPALRPETPYVLHALAEGRVDNPLETNPGMIRGNEYPLDRLPLASYPPPPSRQCRGLLDQAVERAVSAPAPAVVRAAWLFHVVGEIHPFCDGNGRVARLLLLLVAGEDLPRTVDWGVSEMIRFHQDQLFRAVGLRDPVATVFSIIELSTQGALLMAERLSVLGALVPELAHDLGIEFRAAVLVVATWLRRLARLDDLADDLAVPYAEAVQDAQALVARGLLECRPQNMPGSPIRPSYAVSATARRAVMDLVDLLHPERGLRPDRQEDAGMRR